MVGTAAHGPVVEDSDGEHGGAVLAEDEEVPVAQVVGAGEPQPATAQVHAAVPVAVATSATTFTSHMRPRRCPAPATRSFVSRSSRSSASPRLCRPSRRRGGPRRAGRGRGRTAASHDPGTRRRPHRRRHVGDHLHVPHAAAPPPHAGDPQLRVPVLPLLRFAMSLPSSAAPAASPRRPLLPSSPSSAPATDAPSGREDREKRDRRADVLAQRHFWYFT
ncbi:hypothetical protein DAI22_08g142200 [Oryza sativa Japonica Group]|nr:hypothetical protein DAI22_08g142200 [Oryza sativa Japonica Group]